MATALFLNLTAIALANPAPVDRPVLALVRSTSEINIGPFLFKDFNIVSSRTCQPDATSAVMPINKST